MAIAAWAIRQHCTHVAGHTFQSRTGIPELDRQIESLMAWWSRPENCDAAGRHPFDRLIYLVEHSRVTDGDVFLVKLSSGKLQVIESDRVGNAARDLPSDVDLSEWTHGVQVNDAGRALAYMLNDRSPLGLVYRRTVPAKHVLHHGCFDRIDQVRGIAPIASALNTFGDCAEASEYALARMKVAQLFGLKVTRQGDEPLDGHEVDTDIDGEVDPTTEAYSFNFADGPQILDLEPGDDADFLESNQPAAEFQSFMSAMVQAALKSLDLDMSFFDSSHTNYSGARQALILYQKSARIRQAEVRDLLRKITVWRLRLFIEDGQLVLPPGMTLTDLKWEWMSTGWGWIDPLKEAKANVAQIEAGLTSRTRIAAERGVDWLDIADELQAEQEAARDRGLALSYPDLGPISDPDFPPEEAA